MGTFAAVFCMREMEDAPLGGEVMTYSCEQGGGEREEVWLPVACTLMG